MTWREFWNADTPIYVSERHKALHYGLVAKDIAALVPSPDAQVLDYGCGEALSADRVAAACARLYLCDGAPLVRERLLARFGGEPRIEILAPEELGRIDDGSLALIVVNSLLQYLSPDDLGRLLLVWRDKLAPDGALVLADVLPPDLGPVRDAGALLAFAWRGGFLGPAILGLARTAVSDYRKLRAELGLTTYTETDLLARLRRGGFAATRRAANLGHNRHRMTFVARPL